MTKDKSKRPGFLRRVLEKITYRLWLLLGGWRAEAGFRFLSGSIIDARRRESKLRSKINELERRLWALEGHSAKETLEKAQKELAEWNREMKPAPDLDQTDIEQVLRKQPADVRDKLHALLVRAVDVVDQANEEDSVAEVPRD